MEVVIPVEEPLDGAAQAIGLYGGQIAKLAEIYPQNRDLGAQYQADGRNMVPSPPRLTRRSRSSTPGRMFFRPPGSKRISSGSRTVSCPFSSSHDSRRFGQLDSVVAPELGAKPIVATAQEARFGDGRLVSGPGPDQGWTSAAKSDLESGKGWPPWKYPVFPGAQVQEKLHVPLRTQQRRGHPPDNLGTAGLEGPCNVA